MAGNGALSSTGRSPVPSLRAATAESVDSSPTARSSRPTGSSGTMNRQFRVRASGIAPPPSDIPRQGLETQEGRVDLVERRAHPLGSEEEPHPVPGQLAHLSRLDRVVEHPPDR